MPAAQKACADKYSWFSAAGHLAYILFLKFEVIPSAWLALV